MDLPAASKKKQQLVSSVLPPPEVLPRPTYVGADLSKVTLVEALAGTAFSPAKKTLFTCEGYVPPAAQCQQAALLAILPMYYAGTTFGSFGTPKTLLLACASKSGG